MSDSLVAGLSFFITRKGKKKKSYEVTVSLSQDSGHSTDEQHVNSAKHLKVILEITNIFKASARHQSLSEKLHQKQRILGYEITHKFLIFSG